MSARREVICRIWLGSGEWGLGFADEDGEAREGEGAERQFSVYECSRDLSDPRNLKTNHIIRRLGQERFANGSLVSSAEEGSTESG